MGIAALFQGVAVAWLWRGWGYGQGMARGVTGGVVFGAHFASFFWRAVQYSVAILGYAFFGAWPGA